MSQYTHNPVGKRIGNLVWFHINYLTMVVNESEAEIILAAAKDFAPEANIVRLDVKRRTAQLIHCPEFDETHEPALAYTYDINKGRLTRYRNNPYIFHQKHLMVMHNYQGFDYQSSLERTKQWKACVVMNDNLDQGFYLKIGREKYWNMWLSKVGIAR
ncbi:hypothetical protein F0267_00510 [Vibrio coralliilyticus]|uniref:Uncharacterized protein n=1 Tax=Vibrio coralliilyticus TaxID=190893 RepID=A0AAN0SHB6_9VIBR|nr:hypothetical protein [Vibrio coralliilyticus]AIW22604.1 hypothetical protein IX92_26440 [Vibrio coralliilyticus]NOH36701.1 hypothetical protein [Vibrio coralliilyticus]PAW02222.1 hypothetical protein CKJ79_16305 [Vibrio coralliilyticus]